MFTRVFTAGDAEAKLKVKALQQLSTEIMPLDHSEIVYGSVSYSELHPVTIGKADLEKTLNFDILKLDLAI